MELSSALTRLKKCCSEVAGFAHSQQLTVSEAGNPPVHKEARYDSTALQAREGTDRGHYWYGQRFCLGKSLREFYQLLLIVWLRILSKCGWYVLLELERRGHFQMIRTRPTLTISSPLSCVSTITCSLIWISPAALLHSQNCTGLLIYLSALPQKIPLCFVKRLMSHAMVFLFWIPKGHFHFIVLH